MPNRISIHALCEEGDSFCAGEPKRLARFLSTPSARRATHQSAATGISSPISIHALCEEGDSTVCPSV